MLRACLLALGAITLAACGGGDGDEGADLARRVADAVAAADGEVAERLQEQGVAVADGPVELSDVACPTSPASAPGDRMTCRASVEATDVAVDVEFGEGGTLVVIGVSVVP